MNLKSLIPGILIFGCGFSSLHALGQTTTIVILDAAEQEKLRILYHDDQQIKVLGDSIRLRADKALRHYPKPLEVIHYEGLLDTDPKRVNTMKSFEDIEAAVNLIYASYVHNDTRYGQKAVGLVTAWANTYLPTGNPINENKLIAFFWAYFIFRDYFDGQSQLLVENWMKSIVDAEIKRERTPNNNWQAKRLKIIGVVGCIINDAKMQEFSIDGFKDYINTAYYDDGRSYDLLQRDALHYHVSGIKPCLSVFINLQKFNSGFDLYTYKGKDGGSIQKSMEYVIPYITGENQHEEWVHTTVSLDRERAAAGLAKYQPGTFYDPAEAKPTLEWACYYHPAWYALIDEEGNFSSTWVGLLNSPAIRRQ